MVKKNYYESLQGKDLKLSYPSNSLTKVYNAEIFQAEDKNYYVKSKKKEGEKSKWGESSDTEGASFNLSQSESIKILGDKK